MVEKRVNNGGTSNKNDTSLRRKQREPMAVALAISFANFFAKYTGDPKGSAPSSSRSEKLKKLGRLGSGTVHM